MKRVKFLRLVVLMLLFQYFLSEMFLTPCVFGHNEWRGPSGQVERKRGKSKQPQSPVPNPPSSGGGTKGGDTSPPRGGGGGTTGRPVWPGDPETTPGVERIKSEGLERWEFWWEYNQDLFLRLRSREKEIFTGSKGFSLGEGDKKSPASLDTPFTRKIRTQVVPALRKGLKFSHYDVRSSSAIALGKIGCNKDIPSLVETLQDWSQEVRESAAIGLGLLQEKESIPFLMNLLLNTDEGKKLVGNREPSTSTRSFAAIGLGLIGQDWTAEHLVKVATDKKNMEDLRICACAALGLFSSKTGAEGLTRLLADPEETELVRSHAVLSLGKMKDTSQLHSVYKTTFDKKVNVERSAIIALGLLTPDSESFSFSNTLVLRIITRLKDIVQKGKDPQSRCWALLSLARIGGDDSWRFLQRSLENAKQNLRAYAGLALAIQASREPKKGSQAITLLEKALKQTKDTSTQAALCIALGIVEGKKVSEGIRSIAGRKGDPSLRSYAALSLGMMDAKDAADTLEDLLKKEQHQGIILSAATALALLQDRRATPLLIDLIEEASEPMAGSLSKKIYLLLSLGYTGGEKAIDTLPLFLTSGASYLERSFAATALGILGERTEVPILSNLTRDMNYRAVTPSLKTAIDLF